MDARMKCCLGMLEEAVSVEYVGPVRKMKTLVENNQREEAMQVMEESFDKDTMMALLLERLRGKSVHKTLKKVIKGTCESQLDHVKGLTSLCTHIIIECQHGHNEYRVLLHDVHARIGQLMSEI